MHEMQVMFDKIPIDNWRPSTPVVRLTERPSSPAIHKITRAWRINDLAFVTDHVAKMLKNATYFTYNGLP